MKTFVFGTRISFFWMSLTAARLRCLRCQPVNLRQSPTLRPENIARSDKDKVGLETFLYLLFQCCRSDHSGNCPLPSGTEASGIPVTERVGLHKFLNLKKIFQIEQLLRHFIIFIIIYRDLVKYPAKKKPRVVGREYLRTWYLHR